MYFHYYLSTKRLEVYSWIWECQNCQSQGYYYLKDIVFLAPFDISNTVLKVLKVCILFSDLCILVNKSEFTKLVKGIMYIGREN